MTHTKDILDSIENRLRQLKGEIDGLNAARAALDGHDSQTSERARRNVTRKARAARRDDAGTASSGELAVEPGGTSTNASGSVARSSRRPTPRRRRAKAARALETVSTGKLELLLSDTDGLTTSALAERANADRGRVLSLLRQLEAAGRIRRTGQRRATRWHAITDEERIQERAAELAARSGQPA